MVAICWRAGSGEGASRSEYGLVSSHSSQFSPPPLSQSEFRHKSSSLSILLAHVNLQLLAILANEVTMMSECSGAAILVYQTHHAFGSGAELHGGAPPVRYESGGGAGGGLFLRSCGCASAAG